MRNISRNRPLNDADSLYENNFPDWFVFRCEELGWGWITILIGLRNGTFFFESDGMGFRRCLSLTVNHAYDLCRFPASIAEEGLAQHLPR